MNWYLRDGRHIPLKTIVTPGSSGVLQFVPAEKRKTGVNSRGRNLASRKISEARQEAKRQWETAKKQIHEPGKMHRLERYGVAQLPYRPQYLDAGTSFNADLQQPLDFGAEALQAGNPVRHWNSTPSGSVVHALLVTPLNSATHEEGRDGGSGHQPTPGGFRSAVSSARQPASKARCCRPGPRADLAGTGSCGSCSTRWFLPAESQQKVEASLEGVAVAKGEHLSLDSEGGAQVTTPRTRYLTTGNFYGVGQFVDRQNTTTMRACTGATGEVRVRVEPTAPPDFV